MRPLILCLPVLFATTAIPCQDQATEVEVFEISVRKKPSIKGASSYAQQGTELEIAAKIPGTTIISLDKKATKLTSFVDDAGTDLAAGASKGFFYWVSMSKGFGKKAAKDVVTLRIRSKTVPGAKAARLKLKADIVFVTATGTDKAKQKLTLEKGKKITAGPFTMKIAMVKNALGKIELELQSTTKLHAIQKFEFFDGAGKPIKTENKGSGSSSIFGTTTYSKSFGLATKDPGVTVEITFHKNLKKVTLPLDLDLGLGL
jgi:hypothetical protein